MGADKSAENTPNAPKKFQSNLSAQAQKFGIFEKKLSLVVRSTWSLTFKCVKKVQLFVRNWISWKWNENLSM